MKKLLSILALAGTVVAHAAGTDELWEMTTKMETQGMSMPGRTSTVCLPSGGQYKPESPPESSCQMYDMKSSGNTSSMKMKCTGKNPMEAEIQMTKTADTMDQVMKMNSAGHAMNMHMVGKRVGTCDSGAEKKKYEALGADMQKKGCEGMIDSTIRYGGRESKVPESWSRPQQCGSFKPQLCEKARAFVANGGYSEYITYAKPGNWLPGECGINLEARRNELCQKAQKELNDSFLREYCPIEIKVLSDEYAKSCQGFGRDYTADLARPNAKRCTALRAFGPRGAKSKKGSTGNAAVGVVDSEPEDVAPPKKTVKTKKQQETESKDDSPANTLLDGVKSLKDKFKF